MFTSEALSVQKDELQPKPFQARIIPDVRHLALCGVKKGVEKSQVTANLTS